MNIIKYLSLVAISVGLSLGLFVFINQYQFEEEFGATVTTILSTDQISDSRTTINNNFANLNNAIHWSAGSDYLYTSSSPTFGIILGDTSSSTIGSLKMLGNLNVVGNATATNATTTFFYISDSLTIGAYQLPNTDGTANYVLKTDGSGLITWQEDLGATVTQSWEYNSGADAMVTTSTKGFYMTASSTVHNSFRVDGSATTTGSLYLGGDLTVGGTFRLTSYYSTNTPDTHIGTSESSLFSRTITGGDMGVNGIARIKAIGTVSGSSGWITIGFRFGGETIASTTDFNTTGTNNYEVDIDIRNRNNSSAQIISYRLFRSPDRTGDPIIASTTAMTINTAINKTFEIVADGSSAGSAASLQAVDIQIIK